MTTSIAVDVLTPETAKVGEGATILKWSDRTACTIIKVTPKTVWVQEDKSTLDPEWKPEWLVGGFAGHCVNQASQQWIYERDPDGQVHKFRWSEKYQMFGKPNEYRLIEGRHHFYDYNF